MLHWPTNSTLPGTAKNCAEYEIQIQNTNTKYKMLIYYKYKVEIENTRMQVTRYKKKWCIGLQ